MSDKKPVVVYGASGFSGRLVAEYLREFNVPFIAAGRNGARIKEILGRMPGVETANFEVVEVGHSVAELTKLFTGAKVVCNTVGPCMYYAPTVIEAALKAGCHYIDIGGEQEWVYEASEKWGPKFAEKGLLAAPATAYMSVASDIGVNICIENKAIDSIEVISMFNGAPTYGSTQTVFAALQGEERYLEQNQYKIWPIGSSFEVNVPGSVMSHLVVPWAGFPHSIWYKNHPQVANVRTLGGVFLRPVMEGVKAMAQDYQQNLKSMPPDQRRKVLSERAAGMQAGTPPRENPRENRTIDVIAGRGTLEAAQVVMIGTCCYKQTGLIQAFVAQSLLRSAPRKTGFASACEAVGYREILKTLEGFGLNRAKVIMQ
ncbi:MAG TPA: DUF5938 domain-containing protein [Burkholderiales bacterium]